MHIDDATAAIIEAGRRLGARGLISAGEGNLSVRLDPERLLITPSGRRKDELEPADLVIIRLGHLGLDDDPPRSRSGLGPSSDLRIHVAVHGARTDVGAVVHAHLPACMALTLAGEVPDPAALPETALHFPRLPYLAFGEMGSQELAGRVVAVLTGSPDEAANAVILERHGAVAVGPDATTAVDRLELIEVLCRTWRDALLVRAARVRLDGAAIVGEPLTQPQPRSTEG